MTNANIASQNEWDRLTFCCPSNEQQITEHCFPPSVHGVRTNESLTNAGRQPGTVCELNGGEGIGELFKPAVTMPRDGRQPV